MRFPLNFLHTHKKVRRTEEALQEGRALFNAEDKKERENKRWEKEKEGRKN